MAVPYTKQIRLNNTCKSLSSLGLRIKLDGDGVDTVTGISRGREPFSFKHVTQVTATVGTCDFNSLHAHGDVHMPINRTRDLIIKRRPATAAIELQ